MEIEGLDHIVIRAHDAGALVDFYCTVLGCRVERELPPEIGLFQLRAGSALIDIVAVDGGLGRMGGRGPGEDGRNLDHFCVRIRDWDEATLRAELARHGVEGSDVATRYGAMGMGPSIYIRDPEGNTIELKGLPDSELRGARGPQA